MTRRNPALAAALVMAGGAIFALGSAWFFQLVVGLHPCPLCLEQRQGYYASLVIAPLTAHLAWRAPQHGAVTVGLLALLALMLWTTGLAVYHAGAEWAFWPGPSSCTGSAAALPQMRGNGFDLGKSLDGAKRIVSCTQVQWRFLGLSMAGWNAVIAATLALVLGAALARRPKPAGKARQGSSSVSQ